MWIDTIPTSVAFSMMPEGWDITGFRLMLKAEKHKWARMKGNKWEIDRPAFREWLKVRFSESA